MPKVGKWYVYAQHECLYLTGPCYGGDHIVAAMNLSVCPRCGQPCDLFHRDTWARVIRRKVSDRVWYKPGTWGKYHWEYRSKGFLEDGGYNYRKFMFNAKQASEVESDGSLVNENPRCHDSPSSA